MRLTLIAFLSLVLLPFAAACQEQESASIDASQRLFQADGRQVDAAKSDVDERSLSEISIMPAHFALLLAKEELADVVSWLTTQRAALQTAQLADTLMVSITGTEIDGETDSETAGETDNETAEAGKAASTFEFDHKAGRIVITYNGHPVANYEYADPTTTRPFLSQVCAPGEIQVTRNHPPQPGDPLDHAGYHPGVFLAFGDISGHDYWRLKAKVVHAAFVQPPTVDRSRLHFTVKNDYLSTDGLSTICSEICKLTFAAHDAGYTIDWDSKFSSPEADFSFGDQEEMGLGARVATPIREVAGGRLLNSDGKATAKQTWGQVAKWVDYAGSIKGTHAGITIMASPDNVRPSWWHNRDYGVFVANLFGQKAMKQGEASRIVVKRGQQFRLGYRILLHASRDGKPDLDVEYERYRKQIRAKERDQ